MKMAKFFIITVVLSVFLIVHAEDITITLQNDLNEYSGCSDAYIGTNIAGTASPDYVDNVNYGASTELRAHQEAC